ncbi:MAG TPA: AAA family ATPase, partial [Candidatus Kapabacteria bacterium]|nr:AAA family ATPase [Candidatus Kapabacteria bacterium]
MNSTTQTDMRSARRFLVVGTSGSGKTTTARAIAAKLNIPRVEVDALFHLKDWKQADADVFKSKIIQSTSGECWVVDGNYVSVQDLILPRVEVIVWLDLPLSIILYRLLNRTIRRIFSGEELWNGNKETWSGLFARDNVVSWALRRHGINRGRYRRITSQPGLSHLTLVRIRSAEELK